jgi:hypothetical protein
MVDFRGEGLKEGTKYKTRIVTKDISRKDGTDQDLSSQEFAESVVRSGMLMARVNGARKFTTVEFYPSN